MIRFCGMLTRTPGPFGRTTPNAVAYVLRAFACQRSSASIRGVGGLGKTEPLIDADEHR